VPLNETKARSRFLCFAAERRQEKQRKNGASNLPAPACSLIALGVNGAVFYPLVRTLPPRVGRLQRRLPVVGAEEFYSTGGAASGSYGVGADDLTELADDHQLVNELDAEGPF